MTKNNSMIIDVSHHQGKIDWTLVAKNTPKIDGVYIKATTGVGSMDERASYNAIEAQKNGIRIGYYHFSSLNNKDVIEDATEEANWFLKVLGGLPHSDLPLVLDIEDTNPNISLSSKEIEQWIKTFFSVLEAKGIKNYAIYSYQSFLDLHLPADHKFGNIPLWIAQYRTKLTLPKGWTKYFLWQYANNGKIQGIPNKDVDLNKS